MLRGIDLAFDRKPEEEPLTPQNGTATVRHGPLGYWPLPPKIDPKYADRFFDLGDALYDQSIGGRSTLLRREKRRSAPNPTQIEAAKANVVDADAEHCGCFRPRK